LNTTYPLRIKAVEFSTIIYLVVTGILIILNHQQLRAIEYHLLIRLLVILFAGFLIIYNKFKKSGKTFQIIRQFWVLPLLGYFYGETDYLNNLIFKENLDSYFANFEFRLFAIQPAEMFSEIISFHWFAELMYLGYFSYYLLIIGIPVLTYIKLGPAKSEQIIFIVINSFYLYYLFFILIPVAGPQFYFLSSLANLPDGYIFGYLVRSVQALGEAPTGAFPSSHVSICLMLLWLTANNLKKWMTLVIPITVLLLFSTVYIKAHYLIDVLAAVIITPFVYYVSQQIFHLLTLKNKPYEPKFT
jgi:membrane-associated phospholipid phosphatase